MSQVIPLLTRKVDEAGNPGDVFIRYGLEYIIRQVAPQADLLLIDKFGPEDISLYLPAIKKAGFLIYAGTPQFNNYDDWCLWFDHALYKDYIKPNKIAFYSLAAGSGFPRTDMSPMEFSQYCLASEKTREILALRKSVTRLITARDLHVMQLLTDFNWACELLPCTATWSLRSYNTKIEKTVGFVPANPKMVNPALLGLSSHDAVGEWMYSFYQGLKAELATRGYETVVICHGEEELRWFGKLFETLYSKDPKTLLGYYANLHGVISARLHGAIPIAALPGRRSVLLGIDTRLSAAELLRIPVIKLPECNVQKVLESYFASIMNRQDIIKSSEVRYKQLIGEILRNHEVVF